MSRWCRLVTVGLMKVKVMLALRVHARRWPIACFELGRTCCSTGRATHSRLDVLDGVMRWRTRVVSGV